MKRMSMYVSLCLLMLMLAATFSRCQQPVPTGLAINGTTLVPLRYIAEWLGATVDFNAGTRRITLQTATRTLLLTLDSTRASIGDRDVTLQVPAMERNGTTYVPLRFVAEGFNAEVSWDAFNQQAVITHPESGAVAKITVIPDATKTAKVPDKSQLLKSLKTAVRKEVTGGKVTSASIHNFADEWYGVMALNFTYEESPDCGSATLLYRYEKSKGKWMPCPRSYDEESGMNLIDTSLGAQEWGVPQAILDGWLKAANR